MRIVIATAVYYPMINGVAVFSHNLAVGLAARGHEVLVLCPSQTGKSYMEKVDGVETHYLKSTEIKIYPDQIHKVPEKRKFWYKYGFRASVFPGKEIRRILDEFRPEVIHVQVSDPIGLSCVSYARRHNVPVVTTEHNQPEVLTEPLGLPKVIRRPTNALLAAYFVYCRLTGKTPQIPENTTMIGALLQYITTENKDFQPMGSNMGILPPLENHIRDKRERYMAFAVRGKADIEKIEL